MKYFIGIVLILVGLVGLIGWPLLWFGYLGAPRTLIEWVVTIGWTVVYGFVVFTGFAGIFKKEEAE